MSDPDRLYALPDPITDAVHAQLGDPDPAHEDFYAWGYVLTTLTARIEDVAGILYRQVSAYGDRRSIRDDEGAPPAERLAEAAYLLGTLAVQARAANATARQFHSTIGHIGVQVDPDTADQQ